MANRTKGGIGCYSGDPSLKRSGVSKTSESISVACAWCMTNGMRSSSKGSGLSEKRRSGSSSSASMAVVVALVVVLVVGSFYKIL